MKEPKLRFKEFKDEWQEVKVSDLLNYEQPTKYIVESEEYLKSGTPVLTANKSFVLGYTNEQGLYDKGACIIFDDFTEDFKYVDFPFMVKSSAIKILTSNDKSDIRFMFNLFNSVHFINEGHSRHYISSVQNKKVFIPSLKEQQKIAEFFTDLDNQTKLQSDKLETLKRDKKGYLQKMFPSDDSNKPKLRLKGFSNDWKEVKLDEVGSIKSGYGFNDKEQNGIEGTPFYKVSDMVKNDNVMDESSNYVTDEQIENNKWKVINPKNDSVIFAKVGAALNKNRKRLVKTAFLMDNNLMSYSFNDSWNSYFGFMLFKTIYLPKFAQTGALPSFNASDIGDIRVYRPSMKEQQMIGMFFKNLDKQIELQQRKVTDLKNQKKAYLQKMFI